MKKTTITPLNMLLA